MKKRSIALLLLLCLLSLGTAGSLNRALYNTRVGRSGGHLIADGTPLVRFVTIVLGGFRGIIADVLWLRASALQDEGRFFELAQLSDWITQLEPHCVDIWAFHAWNMAYNISVVMPEEEDRWRWVLNGIRLLRDRAIPANPGDPEIHAELAWLLQQKVGSAFDSSHVYYKRQWADQISKALPTGFADYSMLAKTPDLQKQLAEDHGLNWHEMKTVDLRYGPLDWRVAQTHAVYWAALGRSNGVHSLLRCRRILYQNMATSFFSGRLPFKNPDVGFPQRARPDLFNHVCLAFEEAVIAHPDEETIPDAYSRFLRAAVLLLAATDNADTANAALRILRSRVTGIPESIERFILDQDMSYFSQEVRESIMCERTFTQQKQSHKGPL